jgi:membrane protease YdiL (CAAX protease family)
MIKEPILKNFPVVLKLISLLVIIIICVFIFNLLGFAIAIPIWGSDAIQLFNGKTNLNINNHINFFKYLQIVNQFGMFILPSVLFAFLVRGKISVYLKMNRLPQIYSLLAGISIIVVSMPLINWLISINQMMHLPSAFSGIEEWMRRSEDSAEIYTKAFLNVSSLNGLIINIFMMAVLPAIGEEFLFRGVLFKLFKDWSGKAHFAIILSAFLFSAMHLQFFGFFPRMVLGLLLGYMFYFSKNLWVPIAAHFFNNAFAVIVTFLNNKKIIQTDIDALGSESSDYLFIILSLILTMVLIGYIYKTGKNKKEEENQIPSSFV